VWRGQVSCSKVRLHVVWCGEAGEKGVLQAYPPSTHAAARPVVFPSAPAGGTPWHVGCGTDSTEHVVSMCAWLQSCVCIACMPAHHQGLRLLSRMTSCLRRLRCKSHDQVCKACAPPSQAFALKPYERSLLGCDLHAGLCLACMAAQTQTLQLFTQHALQKW
jgi:hypothetical protein